MSRLTRQVRALPRSPGVYFFRDKAGRLLYVGKASDLRSRVATYLRKDGGHSDGTRKLKRLAVRVEHAVAGSELEALLQEARAIQEGSPEFNHSGTGPDRHAFVKLTSERFPRVRVARDLTPDGSRYYGPFGRARDLQAALDALQPVLRWRRCSTMDHRRCLYLQMDRCVGPCLSDGAAPGQLPLFTPLQDPSGRLCGASAYDAMIEVLDRLFRGDGAALLAEVDLRMREAADALEFERAATLRRRRVTLCRIIARSRLLTQDRAVVSLRCGAPVRLLAVRSGRLVMAADLASDPATPDGTEAGATRTEACATRTEACATRLADQVAGFLERAWSGPGPGAARSPAELREVQVVTSYLHRHRKEPWIVSVRPGRLAQAAGEITATVRFLGAVTVQVSRNGS